MDMMFNSDVYVDDVDDVDNEVYVDDDEMF